MTTTNRADFEAVFPSLVEDLLNHAKKYNLPDNALQWFEKVPLPRDAQQLAGSRY